jgi:LuxR family transcriptional regulator, maltose regulon positive regulatory protein
VTVVSAPPGSGKTSLLRSWIREAGRSSTAAWLPLGHAERDPQRFWASVLDAVRQTDPGSALVSEATAPPDLDGWTFVEGLIGDLARFEDRMWLVVDDLDELDATAALRQLELLLAHAPEELRFALSTRRDLPLGLHRIRLEGELTELRGADLRFSLDEARELFDAVEVPISESALAVLVDRTEGWAAGLRLAAISLAQHPDPERFVTELAARDWPLASRLLAEKSLDLVFDGCVGQVDELLAAFPGDVATADGELALVFATARLLDGDHEESAAYVELAQRLPVAVPQERRHRFDLVSAELTLVLARWRGGVETALEALPLVEAALGAQPAGERSLSDAFRAVALLNVGVAELWSSRVDDARRDLEEALTLARRAGRPWLEMSCLGHLGIARPWTGLSCSAGLELSEEAARIAEDHGLSEDRVTVTGAATGAMSSLWLGRLPEAERWLQRAEQALHPDGEPGTELIAHHARGVLHLAQGRFEEALAALRAAQRMQTMLVNEHPLSVAARARLLQTLARKGELEAARAALAEISDEERGTAKMRIAAAVIHLAESEPEQALSVLAPVIEGAAPAVHRSYAATEAQILDAVAREQLGDTYAAETSLERALELAEPEGILLPFILTPVRDVLERLPRRRTAHGALRRTILDVLAGDSPRSYADASPLLDELSEAELRVVTYLPSNLRAPEIASELFVSTNTIRTHLRHIYAKLGAHGRAEAVDRARRLGLLAPSHPLR